MNKETAPPKLEASMFPTLPKHGTRLTRMPVTSQKTPQKAPTRSTRQEDIRTEPILGVKCDICGNPSGRPKCGRCWAMASGLDSLKSEYPDAYDTFIATLKPTNSSISPADGDLSLGYN